jgi:hypothetical protein
MTQLDHLARLVRRYVNLVEVCSQTHDPELNQLIHFHGTQLLTLTAAILDVGEDAQAGDQPGDAGLLAGAAVTDDGTAEREPPPDDAPRT